MSALSAETPEPLDAEASLAPLRASEPAPGAPTPTDPPPPGPGRSNPESSDGAGGPLPHEVLEGYLGHTFRNPELLRTALRHKSYVNEKGAGLLDNERLEFLGDAVLQLAVTHVLMNLKTGAQAQPEAAAPSGKAPSEGTLSLLRSQIVSEASLARAAQRIELGRFLLLGRGEEQSGGRRKPSLLADAYEAVIGALYCDTDFGYTLATVQRLLGEQVAAVASRRATDFKSALQELLQAQRHTRPRYELLASSGPEHEKVFLVAVWLGEERLGQGEGRSKREAEHKAAEAALLRLSAHPDFAATPPGRLDCGHAT